MRPRRSLVPAVLLACALLTRCGEQPRAAVLAPSALLAPTTPAAPVAPAAPSRSDAPTLMAEAASLAQAQTGYNFSFELSFAGASASDAPTVGVKGSGAVDSARGRSSMTLDFRDLRALLADSMDGAPSDIESVIGDGLIEAIQEGDTVHLKMPLLAREMGAQTPWVSLRLPEAATGGAPAAGMAGLGLLESLGATGSPADYLAQLRAVDDSVREDGAATIRGVPTRRFAGTLDARKLLGQGLPAAEAAELATMLPSIEAFRVPYEVWIDAAGLPRRMQATIDFDAFMAGVGGGGMVGGTAPTMTLRSDLFDFGAPAPILVPDARSTTTIDPALLRTLQ